MSLKTAGKLILSGATAMAMSLSTAAVLTPLMASEVFAKSQTDRGTNGNAGQGNGGSGPGNQGKNLKDVGNSNSNSLKFNDVTLSVDSIRENFQF